MTAIRLLLADDHPVVRAGLRAVLESELDIVVVDEVATAESAIARALAASKPPGKSPDWPHRRALSC